MNTFFEENHKLVFQEWISPSELNGATVLDLGSQTGWLGEYCVLHGAKDYVGVDIDKYHIDEARADYPDLKFVHMDLEDYVLESIKENRMFDITVISRTIQGVQNQATVLQNISKITNKIVIESGVPINRPAYSLLTILNSLELPDEKKQEIQKIASHIEYEYPFVEYVQDERWPHPVPSIGFFNEILSVLGFEMDLDTYERVKVKYPEEYGYAAREETDQQMKRCILKFIKTKDIQGSLSWNEWNNIEK